jgi:hypothetical protein
MFRIFRKIREEIVLGKKSRRYASYAAGELVLVVLEQQQTAEYSRAWIHDL